MSGVSTPLEAMSQNAPNQPPTVQIEMAAPQTGLRNRVRQVPDGLAHPSKCGFNLAIHFLTRSHLDSGGSDNRSTNMSNLRNIACALVQINAWALDTLSESCVTDPQLIDAKSYNQFRVLVSEDTRDLVDVNEYGLFHPRFENDVRHGLEKLSDDEILEILGDVRTSTYYPQFIQLCTLLYRTAVAEQNYFLNASNLLVPPKSLDWLKTPQQYLKYLTVESSEAKLRLRSVVLGCQALRDRIKHAAKLGEITPIVLEALKKKMEALQVTFPDACIEVGINSHVLIDSSHEQWW